MRLLALAALLAVGCADEGTSSPAPTGEEGGDLNEGLVLEGQDGKPTFEATGDPELKSDNLTGARGISTSYDTSSTQVWAVTQTWEGKNAAAGLAWGENSGLTWTEKYRRWVDGLKKIPAANGYSETYELITPEGKVLPAPSFECAESMMFLRALFASWYGLPFIMEARSNGGRIYIGHMGFRTATGKYRNTPDFKSVYKDYTGQYDGVNWPSDSRLRSRKLAGGFDDEQPALDALLGVTGSHSGAYLDELLLNKRVGYFMIYLLAYFGSVNLADSSNTYNRDAKSIRPGDIVVHRYGTTGIGHVLVVKEVAEASGQYSVELMSGSMPRRQPDWETATQSRFHLDYDPAGGPGYAAYGGGLKGWRAPKVVNGKWALAVPSFEQSEWIDSSDHEAIADRVLQFREILTSLTLDQQRAALIDRIQAQRDHLSRYPASCSARKRREEAFGELYAFEAENSGMSRGEVDAKFRTLADYVFAELEYQKSKTCCWNQSTESMYEIVMLKAQKDTEDHAVGACVEPTVFMARSGDYDVFRDFAKELGREAEWVAWSADEHCPWAGDGDDEILQPSKATDWGEVGSSVLNGGVVDDGGMNNPGEGTVDGYRVQVGAFSDLQAANDLVEFLNDWWEDNTDAWIDYLNESPSTYIEADETFFRVRLGDYTDRGDAEVALEIVRGIREDLTGAWIVSDQVYPE
jgi:hypothetical protein